MAWESCNPRPWWRNRGVRWSENRGAGQNWWKSISQEQNWASVSSRGHFMSQHKNTSTGHTWGPVERFITQMWHFNRIKTTLTKWNQMGAGGRRVGMALELWLLWEVKEMHMESLNSLPGPVTADCVQFNEKAFQLGKRIDPVCLWSPVVCDCLAFELWEVA